MASMTFYEGTQIFGIIVIIMLIGYGIGKFLEAWHSDIAGYDCRCGHKSASHHPSCDHCQCSVFKCDAGAK